MKYRGFNTLFYDAWFLNVNGKIHAFHIRIPNGDTTISEDEAWKIGHIVSDDLLHFRRCGEILPPLYDEKLPMDYLCKATGCAFIPEKTGDEEKEYYIYYGMRDKNFFQRIGLCTSKDLETFELHPENPVITPDPSVLISYDNINNYNWSIVDCRDLIIVKDPEKSGYLGYFATAADVSRKHPVGVIAVAESNDLIHWNNQRIVFTPKQNGTIEVPDVYKIGDKWYLTMLSGNNYGGRSSTNDDYVTNATIYAVSDSPYGPFIEPEDNIFIGGISESGFTCRTVVHDSVRYLYFVDRSAGGNALSLPKVVKVISNKLCACYCELLRKLRERCILSPENTLPFELIENSFAWKTFGGELQLENGKYVFITEEFDYQAAVFETKIRSIEFESKIKVDAKGGGFLIRAYKDEKLTGDYVLSVEPDKSRIILMKNILFDYISAREYPFVRNTEYHIRGIILDGNIEVYINDILLLQCGLQTGEDLSFGLFCDRGKTEFEELSVFELEE